MLYTSGHYLRGTPRVWWNFIGSSSAVAIVRREVGPGGHSRAAGFILRTAKRRQARYKLGAGGRAGRTP